MIFFVLDSGFVTDYSNISTTETSWRDDNMTDVVVDGGPLGPAPREISGLGWCFILIKYCCELTLTHDAT